jgi:hypothetical protein
MVLKYGCWFQPLHVVAPKHAGRQADAVKNNQVHVRIRRTGSKIGGRQAVGKRVPAFVPELLINI